MTVKHLFYLTATRLSAHVLQRDVLVPGPSFEAGEAGYEAFNGYLQSLRRGLVYVMADVVEEDFHVEMIPYLRGSNRRHIIARRSAQRYRDTSLALSLSLGIEKNERRDERVLLSAFTNTNLLQPWLNVIHQRGLPLVGVYSVALAAAALLRRIAPKQRTALLVSLEPAGLRQTLVQEDRLRFSRLGPLDPADARQPTQLAAAFAAETARIQQYLVAVRALPREGGPLDALLLAPPGRSALIAAAASDTAQIRYHVVDTLEAATRVGLKKLPPGSGSEAVFLYVLARNTPWRQYADETLRHGYRLWQTRAALLASAAAVFAACAVGAVAERFSINELRYQIRLQEDLSHSNAAEYLKVTQSFPKIPTTSENLRAAVTQFVNLSKMASTPEPVLTALSKVLDDSPRIDIDRLRWQGAMAPATAPGAPVAARTAAKAPAAAPSVQDVLQIEGRITGVSGSDYRLINSTVSDFVERLRGLPGVEVLKTKLPFDIGPGAALSGDVLATQNGAAPQFDISIAIHPTP